MCVCGMSTASSIPINARGWAPHSPVSTGVSQAFFENSSPGHRIPGAGGEIASVGIEAHGRAEGYANVFLFRPVGPQYVRHTLDDTF